MNEGFGRTPADPWSTADVAIIAVASPRAVRYWLNGTSLPDRDRLAILLNGMFPKVLDAHLKSERASLEQAWLEAVRRKSQVNSVTSVRDLASSLETILHILESRAGVQNPFARQKAVAFRKLLDLVERHPDESLAWQIQFVDYLEAFHRQAEQHSFLRYFEIGMFEQIISGIDNRSHRKIANNFVIQNVEADDPHRFDAYIHPLTEVIGRALKWLSSDACWLFPLERREASSALEELDWIVNDLEIEPMRINRIRARLERFKHDLIQMTIILAQALLGDTSQALPAGIVFRDGPAAWWPEMVIVPSGSFVMGSPLRERGRDGDEGPQHTVAIADRFALGRYPVTFEEYDAFCAATSQEFADDSGWGRDRNPIINISWHDATAYCRWLSEQSEERYRLPSEAEWEYACRAGTSTPFNTGPKISTELANYDASDSKNAGEKGVYRAQCVPVDIFPANDFGFHQMHGNVMEWCADVWHSNYDDAPADGTAWTEGGDGRLRVLRGGSWDHYARFLRSADRHRYNPTVRDVLAGFRLVREIC